ncbi:sensor histidine kinase [Pontiella sulfatireligans]|nr:histidine kinase [Pontiella sulfatireligans]
MIAITLIAGKLHNNLHAIKVANLKLDELVAVRNAELNALASKLIENSEQTRVALGQELHDGIGQHLTGIQLFCSALAERLHEEQNPNASLADSLIDRVGATHNQIRRIARMLFPVQIERVGFIPVLNELTSCFQDMEHIAFSVREQGHLPELPGKTALQLYRICQETAIYALDHLNANRIDVRVFETPQAYNLEFEHNGSQLDEQHNTFQLTEYRLQQISGTSEKWHSRHGLEKIVYAIPCPETEPQA